MLLSRIVDLRPGEGPRVLRMFALLGLIIATNYVLKPVRSALFLSQFGSSLLPYVYILVAVVLGFVAAAVARFRHAGDIPRLLVRLSCFFSFNLLLFWLAASVGLALHGLRVLRLGERRHRPPPVGLLAARELRFLRARRKASLSRGHGRRPLGIDSRRRGHFSSGAPRRHVGHDAGRGRPAPGRRAPHPVDSEPRARADERAESGPEAAGEEPELARRRKPLSPPRPIALPDDGRGPGGRDQPDLDPGGLPVQYRRRESLPDRRCAHAILRSVLRGNQPARVLRAARSLRAGVEPARRRRRAPGASARPRFLLFFLRALPFPRHRRAPQDGG